MTIALAILALALPIDRGGPALPVHDRGGQAKAVLTPLPHLREWTCIHEHEGAWNANTGNGYYGGLQMDRTFMLGYGRDMIRKYRGWANLWSPRDQIIVAERARKTRGWYPWPNTARMCGLI